MGKTTDLALECYENISKTELDGVIAREYGNVTVVEITNQNGAKMLEKPVGKYITYSLPSLVNDADLFDGRLEELSKQLEALLPSRLDSVLVAGLGNSNITADALGPKANDYILATRHLKQGENKNSFFDGFCCVSNISAGVLGDTGIESAELVKGAVSTVKPSCVIAVDALAAGSKQRLGTTVQLSNTGISPGSGVGNHRYEISEKTLGVPVISVGIPTVLSTSLLDSASDGSMFVTPREIDRIIEQGARLIGMSVNMCLHKNISQKELMMLLG